MQRKCIFCLVDKPPAAFAPEHVFPEAIGGTLLVDRVCRECNSKLGHGVDGPFANLWLVQAKRALLGIGGKTGTIPNPFASGVVAGEPEQKIRTVIDSDGNVEPHYVPNIRSERLPDGTERVRMKYDACNRDEMVKAISTMLRRRGLPQVSAEALLALLQPQTVTPTIEISALLDLDVMRRELLKIAYELATEWLGDGYLADPIAQKMRSCVFAPRQKVQEFALRGAAYLGASRWGDDVTSHIAWLAVSQGSVGAYVRVFELFEGTFEISRTADRYTVSGGRFVAVDPVTGAIRRSTLEDELLQMARERPSG